MRVVTMIPKASQGLKGATITEITSHMAEAAVLRMSDVRPEGVK